MQKLMQTRLFRLLSKPSQEEQYISQLEESCDEFALKLLTRLQFATTHMELYYSLGFVHLKLTGFCELLSGEKGKKCFKDCNEGHVSGWIGYAGT